MFFIISLGDEVTIINLYNSCNNIYFFNDITSKKKAGVCPACV